MLINAHEMVVCIYTSLYIDEVPTMYLKPSNFDYSPGHGLET